MSDRRTVHSVVLLLIRNEQYDAALVVMRERCSQDTRFLDRIAERYVASGVKEGDLGYQELCRAFAMLELNLSRRVRERMLQAFIGIGFYNHADHIAGTLGRSLTGEEVAALVVHYASGGVRGRHDEERLLRLALKAGGAQLVRSVDASLTEMRRRDEVLGLM
jgi:hypothetical protein